MPGRKIRRLPLAPAICLELADHVQQPLLLPRTRQRRQRESDLVAPDPLSNQSQLFTQKNRMIAGNFDDHLVEIAPIVVGERIEKTGAIHLDRPAEWFWTRNANDRFRRFPR